MPQKLKTTGDLRGFLLRAIEEVDAGRMDSGQAASITKLAGQINASLLAEIEVARIMFADNKAASKIGSLEIASDVEGGPKTIDATPAKNPEAAAPIKITTRAQGLSELARVIDRRPSGIVNMGEPEPGRSALDKRNAGAST